MKETKIEIGDLVHLNKSERIENDCDAIVLECDKNGYHCKLFIDSIGECAGYDKDDFKFIQRDRTDLIRVWRDRMEKEKNELTKNYTDLEWIFNNHRAYDYVKMIHLIFKTIAESIGFFRKDYNSETYLKLCFESYYEAIPFIEKKDFDGWKKHCLSNDLMDKLSKFSYRDYYFMFGGNCDN